MLKLLIADSSEEFCLALAEQTAGTYRVRRCHQGKDALELILSYKPDLLVLDLMLPELDGISVLQRAMDGGVRPIVLATTRIMNDYVQEQIARLDVAFAMIKPCDVKATAEHLRDLANHLHPLPPARPDIHTLTANILLKLGFSTKHNGYNYLREAIPLAMQRPGQMVTKQIYPEVGRLCDAGKDQVERCIRTAIDSAFRRRKDVLWREFFQPGPDGNLSRPSNGLFISTLAERLRNEDRA
jgi:two-component system response regulator (stage 0 sporulation protein A)